MEKIVSIKALGRRPLKDISVSGNRLFYANKILTHNSGFNNTDPDLTNTAESFGLPATADFMFALIRSDEMQHMNQLVVKILKNRYGNPNFQNKDGKISNKFVIGVDYSKQKLYEDAAMKQDLTSDLDIVAQPPTPQRCSFMADDTPPWDDEAGTKDWNGAASVEWKGQTAEPVFEIDLPPKDREFRGVEEDAERRRNADKGEVMSYAAHRVGRAHENKLKME